jgi:NADH-quinone oxidoreductase subunit C
VTQKTRNAAKPARRRGGAAPEAPAKLDGLGTALSAALPAIYEGIDVEIGAAVDEVTVTVSPELIPEICRIAKEHPELDFDYLRCISAVDYVDRIEVDYHLFSLDKRHKMVVKTNVSPDEAYVPTVVNVWRGANWFEREAHDLFGVVFRGHPNLAPLLLYDGFEGHPGLKSFPYHEYEEW